MSLKLLQCERKIRPHDTHYLKACYWTIVTKVSGKYGLMWIPANSINNVFNFLRQTRLTLPLRAALVLNGLQVNPLGLSYHWSPFGLLDIAKGNLLWLSVINGTYSYPLWDLVSPLTLGSSENRVVAFKPFSALTVFPPPPIFKTQLFKIRKELIQWATVAKGGCCSPKQVAFN